MLDTSRSVREVFWYKTGIALLVNYLCRVRKPFFISVFLCYTKAPALYRHAHSTKTSPIALVLSWARLGRLRVTRYHREYSAVRRELEKPRRRHKEREQPSCRKESNMNNRRTQFDTYFLVIQVLSF